jgi:hypothetical protein
MSARYSRGVRYQSRTRSSRRFEATIQWVKRDSILTACPHICLIVQSFSHNSHSVTNLFIVKSRFGPSADTETNDCRPHAVGAELGLGNQLRAGEEQDIIHAGYLY